DGQAAEHEDEQGHDDKGIRTAQSEVDDPHESPCQFGLRVGVGKVYRATRRSLHGGSLFFHRWYNRPEMTTAQAGEPAMSEQPAPPDSPGRELPCQMDVYFDSFRSIDTAQLAQFVNSREPGEACEVTALEENENEEGLRIGGFSAAQGGLIIGALNHSVP